MASADSNILQTAERFSKEVQSKAEIEAVPLHRQFIGATENDVRAGYEAIANGEVAVAVLAGGQATRLGADLPKGLFELPLNDFSSAQSKFNTLLFLQAAQISNLQKEIKKMFNKEVSIPWIVMTSESTDAATKKYMADVVLQLQLNSDQLIFIKQASIPCFDLNGDVIMNGEDILKSPNGNGGFYDAIRDQIPHLRSTGIKYLHVYCVDNILCRVADPGFVGRCVLNKADCAAKVVEKKDPHEKIGIIGVENKIQPELVDAVPEDVMTRYSALEEDSQLRGKSVAVIEYSEISKEQAEKRDPQNLEKLYFAAGNIANHLFHLDFLEYVCHIKLPYHIARKNIKHFSSSLQKEIITPGTKLERFIFDVFPYSRNFLLYEVKREEEFAPLKNNEAAGVDCPSSCVEALKKYHELKCSKSVNSCLACIMKELTKC